LSLFHYVLLTGAWLFWMAPFLLLKRNREQPAQVDKRARWGILLQSVAYCLVWQSDFWNRRPAPSRVALAALFFTIGALLSWTAVRTLGRQWRIDAGLNPDHELVRAGPYRVVRHPIYASMICMWFGTGLLVAPMPLFALCLAILIAGTEIRVRLEDSLLASRFGDDFRSYQTQVAAYVPYVR